MSLVDELVTVVEVAADNHGIVTRHLLLEEGVRPAAIAALARDERAMRRVGRGVYQLVQLQDDRWCDYRQALQRLDPTVHQQELFHDPLHPDRGVLSHLAAAHVWGAVDLPWDTHLTTPRRRRLSGVTVHTACLTPEEVTLSPGYWSGCCDAVPVTTVERTTRDLVATLEDADYLRRWVEHCHQEGLLTETRLVEMLGDRLQSVQEGWFGWEGGR